MKDIFAIFCGLTIFLAQVQSEICQNASGCRCQNDKDFKGIYVTCSGLNPRIDLLPYSNTTRLVISESNFTTSSLRDLRNLNLSNSLRIANTNLPEFNWAWLPATCQRLIISHSSSPTEFYSPHVGACVLPTTLNLTRLYLTGLNYHHIPKCLPNTLTILSLVNIPLLGFEGGNKTDNYLINASSFLPPKLEYLYISNPQFTKIDNDLFMNIPSTLRSVTIKNCKNPLPKFSQKWAENNNISYLSIRNCKLQGLVSNNFVNLTKLKTLHFSNNQIETFPINLATTLETIDFSNNNIASIEKQALSRLVNLKNLYLKTNMLTSLPRGLPTNLMILDLSENNLEVLDNTAFSHLTSLERLDVSENKIINMPRNLPSTMKVLNLNSNRISIIQSANQYNYCVNCTVVNLYNNPWVCDDELIRMLIWFQTRPIQATNPVRITVSGVCNSLKDDIGSIEIDDILSYIKYIGTHFPSCTYDVKNLICNASIAELTEFPKMPPNGLRRVEIANNPSLTNIPDNLFQSQTNFEILDLGFNGLTNFPIGLPPSLNILTLIGNKISYLPEDPEAFASLANLKILVLSSNNLTTVFDYQFDMMTSLTQLYLLNNPWLCDCSLQSFVEWLILNRELETSDNLITRPHCVSPESAKGSTLLQLTGVYLYEYKCAPDRCIWTSGIPTLNCSLAVQEKIETSSLPYIDNFTTMSIPENKYWRTLDISNIDLKADEIHLQQLPELINLDLSGNLLTYIPLNQFPTKLKQINLAGNVITKLPAAAELSEYVPILETLDLRNNQLATIPSSRIGIFHLIDSLYLEGNTLVCDCTLKPLQGYIQSNRDNQGVINDHQLNNLACHSPTKLSGRAIVNVTEEMYCPGVNVGMIVGAVTAMVLVVIIIVVVTNIIYNKRRKLQERKDIVQGFKELLEQEALRNDQPDAETGVRDAPTYEYDAFVSYRGQKNDEDFVYKMLEELEDQRHRKVCLHERDFTPGKSIAENIVECIGSSRRVILVISRKYAASGWCQYEVQVALAHLHKSRQCRLLIPVLLEDITKDDNTVGSVHTILSLISGIHAPHFSASTTSWRNFWNKLDESVAENIVNQSTRL